MDCMKGIGLREKPLLRRLGQTLTETATGRTVLDTAACFCGSFLLSALSLGGRPLPLAATLVLAVGLWARAIGALVGAGVGYILFLGPELALEPVALLLSFFAATMIFRDTGVSLALLGSVLTAAVGIIFLLDTGIRPLPVALLVASVSMAGAAPILWIRAIREKSSAAQWAACALLVGGLWQILFGSAPAALLAGGVGAVAGRMVPAGLPARKSASPGAAVHAMPEQKTAERALTTMHSVLAREDPVLQPIQLNQVYDFAAEQVCRCCVCSRQCWEIWSEDTYHDLCAAGEAIMLRGMALREDLPQRFLDRCKHTEGFLTAVNQALDEAMARQREARRLEEGRQVAAGQYLLLSRLLHSLSRAPTQAPIAYQPEMAVGTANRAGNRVSGDRGATCRDRFGHFYVLLCDGMGTGSAARAESDRATRLLTGLLEAGAEADGAMALLNGFYTLRRTAAFSTVDLLKLDLHTGEGTLYKWGAAPSYLRSGEEVKKIGTATVPPGLEAESARPPEQYALSLKEGETLVMVSDGAYGAETEQRLKDVTVGTVRDLAACLITLGESDAADDRTVLTLRLKPMEDKQQASSHK